MKGYVKWIIGALVLILVIVGAYFLYNALMEDYAPDTLGTPDGIVNSDKESGDDTGSGEGQDNDTGSGEGQDNDSEKHKAPDFTAIDWDGNEVKLSDYIGKPIVLNFWATWCGYCVQEMPVFAVAQMDNPDVQFLMVNVTDGQSETVESAKAFIEKQGYGFPVLFDTELEASMRYGASSLPVTFFINAEGELVAYQPGALSAELLDKGISMITE